MPFYRVYFRYVDSKGKVRHDHSGRLTADNKDHAKRLTIYGEKPRMIAVDRVVRL